MSTTDLLSSTLNWPGKGHFGLKSSGKCIEHDRWRREKSRGIFSIANNGE